MKTPWLIQRGKINVPLAPVGSTLSECVNQDYMGSAYFEFGALPQSMRRIEQKLHLFRMRRIEDIKSDTGFTLRVYSYLNDREFQQYGECLRMMRGLKKMNFDLEESSYFEVMSNGSFSFVSGTNFWWDIENDVMWSFNKTFMSRLPKQLQASFDHMNESHPENKLPSLIE